jgi:hypothetical protein
MNLNWDRFIVCKYMLKEGKIKNDSWFKHLIIKSQKKLQKEKIMRYPIQEQRMPFIYSSTLSYVLGSKSNYRNYTLKNR